MKNWKSSIGVCFLGAVFVIGQTNNLPPLPPAGDPPPTGSLAGDPLTPVQMGLEPPTVPAITPAVATIRFQARESLENGQWFDEAVIHTKKGNGFYRIVIEKGQ